MEAESVQCVVTSPPYWGLRRYDGQQEVIWGGQSDCDHEWSSRRYYTEQSTGRQGGEAFSKPGVENVERLKAARWREDAVCVRCGAWLGAYGLEPTPELYVEHTISILREIRRVLRPDGVVWWNIGDSYAGSGQGWQKERGSSIPRKWLEQYGYGRPPGYISSASPNGLKPKDLCMVPFRVALAAQADGWWVRSVVVWNKLNPMPESVKDRPTESHEYVLLLTRSERYFYDADAVREPHQEASFERVQRRWAVHSKYDEQAPQHLHSWMRDKSEMRRSCHPAGRNMRTVWRFATYPYPGAHFAVFPPELPRRCILAGSSPKVCATCGAPWRRQTQREIDNTGYPNGPGGNYAAKGRPPGGQENDESSTLGTVARYRVTTLGWGPTCTCHGQPEKTVVSCDECDGTGLAMVYPEAGPNTAEQNKPPYGENNPHLARLEKEATDEPCPACAGTGEIEAQSWPPEILENWPTRPAIILDPFAGSGTTLMVAEDLGRWWIGIDICEDYLPQIRKRTAQRSLAAAFENVIAEGSPR